MVKLLILAISIFVATYLIPGIQVDTWLTVLIVALVMAIVNAFIKPILVLLTLPLTLVTLGLFLLILNGLMVMLVSVIVPGFHVDSLLSGILFSIVVSLTSSILSKIS